MNTAAAAAAAKSLRSILLDQYKYPHELHKQF